MAQMTGSDDLMKEFTEYKFNFPKNKRAGFPMDQLKHAAGEVVEASVVLNSDNRPRFLDECMDVIECMEGILRKYSECCPETLNAAYWYHINKNIQRGDYE